MRERPIPFSAPMVRAVLDGSKTQTRRIVTPQFGPQAEPAEMSLVTAEGWQATGHSGLWWDDTVGSADEAIKSPYGIPGDRLWVREAWRSTSDLDQFSGSQIAELCVDAGYRKPWAPLQYEVDGTRRDWKHTSTPPHEGLPMPGRYRHGRFMPRWASRILLEVTGVRVERLQDISEDDAKAEGVSIYERHSIGYCIGADRPPSIRAYGELWEQLNGAGSWNANLWVWVIEFRRIS